MPLWRRTKGSDTYRITTARKSIPDDQAARVRGYVISMSIRIVCFLLAAVTSGWVRWTLVACALVIPYIAVVYANGGREPTAIPPTRCDRARARVARQFSEATTSRCLIGHREVAGGEWQDRTVSLTNPGVVVANRTYRVTEIVGTSTDSLEDAVQNGVGRAAETLRHLDWFEVTEIRGQIDGCNVKHWQVGMKVGFRLEDS